MAKVYVGYLYQIEEGRNLVHSDKNVSSNIAPVNMAGGYFLYKKCLFQKNYVREIITGKKIPVIASDASHLKGVHTFMKYDGRIYQKKTTATVEDIENYMKYHPNKEKYNEYMKKVFTFGKQKAKRRFSVKFNEYTEKRNTLNKLSNELETGDYQKRVDSIAEPSASFAYNKQLDRDINAEYAGGFGLNNVNRDHDHHDHHGHHDILDMEDIHENYNSINPISDYDLNSGQRRGNLKQAKPIDIENNENEKTNFTPKNNGNSEVTKNSSIQNSPNNQNINLSQNNLFETRTGTSKKEEEVSKSGVTPNRSLDAVDEKTSQIESNNQIFTTNNRVVPTQEKRVVVSTFGRENSAIIKELAQIAGKGGEAVATIEGVEVSTKYLVDEKDLTEYFLAKRYNRTPESMTVKAVLANEESMNIINKSRSL